MFFDRLAETLMLNFHRYKTNMISILSAAMDKGGRGKGKGEAYSSGKASGYSNPPSCKHGSFLVRHLVTVKST